jgi:hypothetical protein
MTIAAISGVVGLFTPLLDRLFPDPDKRAEAAAKIKQMENAGELEMFKALFEADQAQMEVNKQEAAHASIFVAGWRPFVGWVCGFAFAWQLLLMPMLNWFISVMGYVVPTLPEIDNRLLENALFGMLGIGAMRTIEKVRGVARNSAPVSKLPWQK